VVGANLIYDLDFLSENGVMFPLVHRFRDVQVAEPLLDEGRLEYNLDALAETYLGERKQETLLREAAASYGFGTTNAEIKGNLWRLPAAYVGPYGEGDVDLPLRILALQEVELGKQGLTELFDLESRLIPLLLAMRRRGVRVDTVRAAEVRERLVRERDVALHELKRLAGPAAELMAPESFVKALEGAGLDIVRTAKTDQPSITKGWLEQNKSNNIVAAVLRGRRVDTIINVFLDGHIGRHAINGRIHCEFNQLKGDNGGAISRFSSSNPNLQNLPARDEEIGPLVRSLFIPEDGEDWVRDDLSQIEYRFLAHYARGPGANEARQHYCNDPKTDYHKLCAVFMGVDPNDKFARKKVKGVNFCRIYGGGIPKIAETIGCSIEDATIFCRKYDEQLPFVNKTLKAATEAAQQKGFVTTILHRIQRFNLWEPPGNYDRKYQPLPRAQAVAAYGDRVVRAFTYAALNRVLQGSAADLMKKSMVDIFEAGVCNELGAPLITVHDELDWSVPRTAGALAAIDAAKRIMETCIKLRVPILAEREEGSSWGTCK
jgi:DNA polymerase I-like protein with 3'-5' exonuclease and polymerase domains